MKLSRQIRRGWRCFLPGMLVGAALGSVGAHQLVTRDWKSIAAPLETSPMLIREDAKGSGHFGAPRNGERRHKGLDLVAPVGSPVRAIRGGLVIATGAHRGLGRYLILEHRGGMRSLYAHLEDVKVGVGGRIRQGQVIATVGKTGNAKSSVITPHLHLEVARDGKLLDPETLGLALVDSPDASDQLTAEGGE